MDLPIYIKKKLKKINRNLIDYKVFFIFFLLSTIFLIYLINKKEQKIEYTSQLHLLNYTNYYTLNQSTYFNPARNNLYNNFLYLTTKDENLSKLLKNNDQNFNIWKENLDKLNKEKNINLKYEKVQNSFEKQLIYYNLKLIINFNSNDLQTIVLNLVQNLDLINRTVNDILLTEIYNTTKKYEFELIEINETIQYFNNNNLKIDNLVEKQIKIFNDIKFYKSVAVSMDNHAIKYYYLKPFEQTEIKKLNIIDVIGIYSFAFLMATFICLLKEILKIRPPKL